MAIRTFNWWNFKWGLSDSPNILWEWTFQNWSFWIDTTSEPSWVKLASAIKSSFTTTWEPSVQFSYGWNHYVFCYDKSIYLNWVLKHAYNSAVATSLWVIYWVNVMNVWWTDYLYLLWLSNVHKSSVDLNTILYSIASFASHATLKPSIKYWNDIYFTSKNIFYKLDNAEVITTLYTADVLNQFTWITFFQDTFNLYSSFNSSTSWKQFIFSVSSITSPSYITSWNNLPIVWAINKWWVDYVVAWFTWKDLYAVSGTQKKMIRSNLNWNWTTRDFNGIIIPYLDDAYMLSNNQWLLKFWTEYAWFYDSLVPLWKVTNYTLSTMVYHSPYIYIGWYYGSAYWVYSFELNNPPTFANYYASSWEIISNIYDMWDAYGKKSLLQFDIAYDCDEWNTISPHWWTITLYARKKWGSWTQIVSKTPDSWVWNIRVTSWEISQLWFWDFYQIEFKVKLEPKASWGNNLYTPLFKWLRVTYEDNINS